MADVARLAGVSSQTVSRVSNGQANVEEATRARVLEAMRTLGYRPNSAARALQERPLPHHRRDHVHAVDLRQHAHPGRDRDRGGARRLLGHAGARSPTRPSATCPVAYQRLSAQAVDGVVIILEAHILDRAESRCRPACPSSSSTRAPAPGYTVVDTDQAQGARQATEHLLGLGHRHGLAHRRPGDVLLRRPPGASRGSETLPAARHRPARAAARRLDGGVRDTATA